MLEVGAFEAKNTLGTLLDRVQNGEEVLITRHGKPVARLVPNTGAIDREQANAAAQRIFARSAQLSPVSWTDLKHDRDEGRP